MKRKRKSVKSKPKKPTPAADVCVDPGYYSDVDKDKDGLHVIAEIGTRELNTGMSSLGAGSSKPEVNSETAGSAAAKLARAISSSGVNTTSDRVPLQRERIGEKEPKSSHSTLAYKQELDAALSVIKKIMKMDAAAPFNTPVDPIALGIPDYFDIIDTPMDLGTICSNLEKGLAYRNSADVLKDVQLVWDNCCKYNKKGSYVLELMKRVKNNFMKQWTAAGLYKDQQTFSNGDLPSNPQPVVDSTLGLEQDVHAYPMGSTIRSSVHLQQQNPAYLNHGQHPNVLPCFSHTFQPQPMSYQCSCSLHPGLHYHDMVPQHNPYPHFHPMDPMIPSAGNHWAKEMSPSLMHSRPAPGYSPLVHPYQRTYQHQSSSSQLHPAQLQAAINAPSAGNIFVPNGEPTSTSNRHEHAFGFQQNDGDRNHVQNYRMDSVPPHNYHLSPSFVSQHQLNKSTTFNGLHSSHTEGGRNIEYAGNRPILPPPTESTANFTKHATNCRQPPSTDDNSYQQHQINSTPEQSSSMNNSEACLPQEKNCQNEPSSSASEHLHSVGDNNVSKKKNQVQEHANSKEKSPMVNSQECQLMENACQNRSGSPLSRPSPSSANNTTKSKKKSRGRGPNRCISREAERISINTNEHGQPIGPEQQKLASFLGTLARNGNLLPLTYHDWRAVLTEYKETLWDKVQRNFDIDPKSKYWVLQSVSLKWKNWKSFLKSTRYYAHETDEERLADRDERVLPEQWAALVALWSTEVAEERSAKSRASRAHMKYIHAAGRKSFARVREELCAKMPEGRELSRAELFILTRTRKDGKPVNEETSEVITKLLERENEKDTPQESNKQADILTEVIGPNKKGLSRCIELGPTTLELQKPNRAHGVNMLSQTNMEIRQMKEKMAVVEQTCAQMASQMAAMMSMMSSMQQNPPDKNVLDMVGTNSDASAQPLLQANTTAPPLGASEQSLSHQVNTTPSVPADSTRKTRGRKRKI